MARSKDIRDEIRDVIQMSKDMREGKLTEKTSRSKKSRRKSAHSDDTQPDYVAEIHRQSHRSAQRSARRQRRIAQGRVAGKAESLTSLDDIARELLPAAISHLVERLIIEPSHPPGLGRDLDRLLTPDQAAEILGVHRRWIYDHSAKIGGTKLSRRKLRIRESSLRAYIDAQQTDD